VEISFSFRTELSGPDALLLLTGMTGTFSGCKHCPDLDKAGTRYSLLLKKGRKGRKKARNKGRKK